MASFSRFSVGSTPACSSWAMHTAGSARSAWRTPADSRYRTPHYNNITLRRSCTNGGKKKKYNTSQSFLKVQYWPANSKRGQYYAQIIRAGKMEACPFFFLNFKGTPSQEEQKTIFRGLRICKMALSDQSDFPAIFRMRNFINSTFRCRPCSVRWLYAAKFKKIDFLELTDCGKSM